MIDKKTFISTLNFIQERRKLEDNLHAALEACTDNCYCDFFLYSQYEETVIKLLMLDLNDKYEVIPYFIYDLEFGKVKNIDPKTSFTIDEEVIDLSTSSKLYDFLMKKE